MAPHLTRRAWSRGTSAIAGRPLAPVVVAALALLLVLTARVDGPVHLDRMVDGSVQWSIGATTQGSPHVVAPDVRNATEQVGRPLSGPGPLLAIAVAGASLVAAGHLVLRRPVAHHRRPLVIETLRRRGPPTTQDRSASRFP